MQKRLFFALLLTLCSGLLFSQLPDTAIQKLPTAFVYSVYDGDGCRIKLADGSIRKVRFAGCDAPEFANGYTSETQPYAKQSRDSLRKLILNRNVYIDTLPMGKAKYSYGRLIVNVYTTDTVPVWVNHASVQKGWSWNVTQTNVSWVSSGFPVLMQEAAEQAKESKFGLWGLKGYKTSPATWRKKYKRADNTF